MIMIQADGSIVGQQSFLIERGGIARQKPATVAPRISPDSVAVEIGHDDEAEEEGLDDAPLGEVEEVPERHAEHGNGNGEQRGRRRRRGRRGSGAGGGPREPEATPAFTGGDSAEFIEGDDAGLDPAGEPSQFGGEQNTESRGPTASRASGGGRGRRGGRRNRQDRGPDRGRDPAPAPNFEAHQSGSDFEAEGMPEPNSPPSFEAPQPEPVRSEPPQETSPVAANDSAARRRSTVREPAPIVSFGQDDAPGSYHTGTRAGSARTGKRDGKKNGKQRRRRDRNRPARRSGWWSKFRGE